MWMRMARSLRTRCGADRLGADEKLRGPCKELAVAAVGPGSHPPCPQRPPRQSPHTSSPPLPSVRVHQRTREREWPATVHLLMEPLTHLRSFRAHHEYAIANDDAD